MRGGARSLPALAAALAMAAAVASGCGGEREFDEQTVTAALNEAGAGLVLGEPLPVGTEGVEIHAVSLDPQVTGGGTGPHSDGALVVLADSAAAEDEFARCQSAIDFTCFRAANVVLRFTGMSPVDQQHLADSLSAIGTEDG